MVVEYNLVYFAILFIGLVEKAISTRYKISFSGKASLVVCGILLTFIASVRYQNEYSDFWVVYRHLLQAPHSTLVDLIQSKGPLDALLRYLCMLLFKDPQSYFCITASFIVLGYVVAIQKYSPYQYLPVFLFFTGGSFFTANNVTRQVVAVTICLYSIKYILNRKLGYYLLMIVVATLIHSSSVFFLPCYFLAKIDFKKNQLYLYILVGILIVIFRNPVIHFFQRFLFSEYTGSAYGITSSNPLRLLLTLFEVVFLLIFIMNRRKIIDQMTNNGGLYLYNFIAHGTIISMLLSVLSATSMLLMSRIALFYSICGTLCTMYALKISPKRQKLLLTCLIFVVYSIWFFVMNYYGKLIPTPYTPFWLFSNRF